MKKYPRFQCKALESRSPTIALPQLTLSVTNKALADVEFYKKVFGGAIYFDTAQNGYYK